MVKKIILIILVVYLLVGIGYQIFTYSNLFKLYDQFNSPRPSFVTVFSEPYTYFGVVIWPLSASLQLGPNLRPVSHSGQNYAPGEIIVGFNPGVATGEAETILTNQNLSFKSQYASQEYIQQFGLVYLVKVPVGQEQMYVDQFSQNSKIKYATLNGFDTIQ